MEKKKNHSLFTISNILSSKLFIFSLLYLSKLYLLFLYSSIPFKYYMFYSFFMLDIDRLFIWRAFRICGEDVKRNWWSNKIMLWLSTCGVERQNPNIYIYMHKGQFLYSATNRFYNVIQWIWKIYASLELCTFSKIWKIYALPRDEDQSKDRKNKSNIFAFSHSSSQICSPKFIASSYF